MENENKKVKKLNRSPAYPSIDLKAAVELVKRFYDLFSGDKFSRETAAEKLGLAKTGYTYRKIAALVYYGLLDRAGSSYKSSSLAKEIVLATEDGPKLLAISKAVKNPKIYSQLIHEYSGEQLPAMLDNKLRQLDYSKEAAISLAKVFKDSLEYAGLLSNGIVSGDAFINNDGTNVESKSEGDGANKPETPLGEEQGKQPKQLGSAFTNSQDFIPYPLDCGITVLFPTSLLKKIASGDFKECLNTLEKLGKGKVDGTSKTDASNTSVESD